MTDIFSLPDYVTLTKLAAALWQQDGSYHGAAVMVGAGFSRCAASTGNAQEKMPLWNDFSKKLASELDSRSSDPLRLAEEYSAFFGKQALHDLIKKVINDPAWKPGNLHKDLLELPWSEVLTTNWDTLLERASANVYQPAYSLVSKQEDLSSARSPRIVKLHGTIDVTKDLIFTQEDYRKYPQNHAAFVNFSRQVFIENELCLLGFSGDDPNFLQWAGWVRDHLSSHTRRIYLVGALGLNSAKRKYLESINVAPIDLSALVADLDEQDSKHLEATRIFIKALQDLRPKQCWEWTPTNLRRKMITQEEDTKLRKEPEYAAKLLEGHIPLLAKDRESYPDWVVCPPDIQSRLKNHIDDPWPTPKNLSLMIPTEREKLLYEICWHYKVTFSVFPNWLVQELLKICNPDNHCSLTKRQQLEIALLIHKNTRWMSSSEAEPIIETTKHLLSNGDKYHPECSNELSYHNALLARDSFDYKELELQVNKISTNSPIWMLKKGGLLSELGQFEHATKLISEAHKELLLQHRNNKASIHALSRLACAHWLMRGINMLSDRKSFEKFPTIYDEYHCSPSEYMDYINGRIDNALQEQRKNQEIEPSFSPGYYKDNSQTVTISNEIHPFIFFEGVLNSIGMPLRWESVNFCVDKATRLAELEDLDNLYRFSLAIRAANSGDSPVLKKLFSRINIACLSDREISFLVTQCKLAIDYWSKKIDSHAVNRLGVFIEVLARVSVRVSIEQAKELFKFSVSLSKNTNLRCFWLFDAIGDLVNFTLDSIPKSQHKDVLLDALSFPLQVELGIEDHGKWVNPVIWEPGDRISSSTLDRRIDEIIDSVVPSSSKAAPALIRLLSLSTCGFLLPDEKQRLSQKIWGEHPDYSNLPETGLLKHTFLTLPSGDPSLVKSAVRKYLFDVDNNHLLNRHHLNDICQATKVMHDGIYPSEEQAIKLFNLMVDWRPRNDEGDILGWSQQEDEIIVSLIGDALSLSIAPSLSKEDLTEDNYNKLFAFYNDTESPNAMIAFTYFATANHTLIERVEKTIRQGFHSKGNFLAFSSRALLKWRGMMELPVIERLILRLVYLTESGFKSGLSVQLSVIKEMLSNGFLNSEHIDSLVEIIPVIFDNSNYVNISPSSRESVSISFVRASCVELAKELLNKTSHNSELIRILDEAQRDSLPEVRFAVLDESVE
ncbi:SIR2 family NAD-dependent protein deacylase [Aeromonas dhakensis]|uniref:SIR2 family NAD-dependent protein deacylase n=1 Tax=Aeromonas dhakensis TaxID=196024 RepID=UPI0020B29CBC|nr:SIR2 family protein [Aeromonas dhakensis]WPS56331.1 SIR2 family protein [Aeromonas dhakensis]WRT73881.1 SIR2 family protein [Aeromonas dhakensis]CAD7492631.1 hypothetical protein KBAD45_33940 [Aeromonas dhakensis]CAD7502988.1 hypothetical protein KBAD50_08570 [Aeromonas dhakensis]CAD7503227.1 hypothetical protein KBAD49_08570 [Aeromonas dhakensis]